MKRIYQFLFIAILFISCSKDKPIVQYKLTTEITPTEGGTVSPSSGTFDVGTEVTLTATPAAEYIFKEWKGGMIGTTNPMKLIMSSDKNVSVVFEKRKYPLSVVIEGEGTVTEEVVQTKSTNTDYPSGTIVKLTAVPNIGSEFIGWSGDYQSSDSSLTITVDKPTSIIVSFKKIIYPTALISGNDSILIGDTTNINVQFTGTPPFSFDYNDGNITFTITNINDLYYNISVTPKQSTIYTLTSVKDTNRSGTVSGSFDVYVQPYFVSKTANYMGINLTVGNIKNNLSFKGNYYHIDELATNFSFTIEDNNGVLNNYTMSDHSYVFFDYNNDGYLDLFGFMMNATFVFGRYNGKYILVDNVLSSKKSISFFDSDIASPSGMEVGDYNNDGITDALFYSYNDHPDMGGQILNTVKPVKVFLFNRDGTFKEVDATIPLTVHDMASGDVDNDGDVDLLVWEYSKSSKPRLYLNDGSANFTEALMNNFRGLTEIMNTWHEGFDAIAVELFDIDNDGYLDIIMGQEIGGSGWDYIAFNNSVKHKLKQQRIYWGDGTGQYDFISNYTDLPNNTIDTWSFTQPTENDSVRFYNSQGKCALGFNFIDYDNDGDYDILTAITPLYSGYIQQLHENLGDKTFKDVTKEMIGNYDGSFGGSYNQLGYHIGSDGDFPNFYEIRPYDVDNDGDLDLVPHGVACWDGYNYSKNCYWENVFGKFVLHK